MCFFRNKKIESEKFEIIETTEYITVKDIKAKIASIENTSMEVFKKAYIIQEEKNGKFKS